ncbi:hypothetical protein PMAYCL1PPCAC_24927, partial [Pristionchus mayeri]
MESAGKSDATGVIRLEVHKVSGLDFEGRYSPEVEVGGVPWKINVCKQQVRRGYYLAVYLNSMESLSRQWSIDVDCETILVHADSTKSFTTQWTNTFDRDVNDFGEHTLMEWNELFDGQKGFVNADKITVEVRIKISNMRGIRMSRHFDFTDPDEPNHDLALIIEGQKIYVNKGILAAHSPVFYAMFFGNF